ncbi:haloacid dehalogenase-like hydrolase domain-containing protein [Iris pallida]|uniref:Haloacid dehalogenase-like hydrolase domain-containing protein n=1 Tax=Iris pallida TaxID=29817 RepID=A0AAX6I1W7_IRIPA|nr:haloacid dehalogenase-like hydrolase domain-containing protein [Iris pallida]
MEAAVSHSLLLLRRSFPFLSPPRPAIYVPATPTPFSSSSSPPPPIRSFLSSRSKKNAKPSRTPPPPPSCSSSSDLDSAKPSPQDLAILLEVEGVLADAHRSGNREAFNVAFQKHGLDCANWTEPVYMDLTRKAGGDEERMLIFFFNQIGWPTSLPTNEKEAFMKRILQEKRKALEEFAASSNLTLRPGVENFIDDAVKESLPLVFLTAYSKSGEKMARSVIEKLGYDRISKVKIIGKEEVKGSFYGQLVLGTGVSSTLDEQIAKEARKAVSMEKQRVAEEVASILKLSVDIDTSPPESLQNVVATLRAAAENVGLPVQNCVLIAGSQSGVIGAEHIGMPCLVLRSSLTARAEFKKAKAVMDGFGGADLTISKLRNKLWS